MTVNGREYFGTPGHCYDIDGFLWHDPGACKDVFCQGQPGAKACCGYEQ